MIQKTLPDGKQVTCFPLSIPQQFMLGCSIRYGENGKYPINNIACGYYFLGGMDEDVMKESIHEAIDRCETMRLRFLPDEKFKVVQYINDKTDIKIDTLDYSDKTLDEAHEILLEKGRGRVPMFLEELHSISLVRLSEGYNGFFMKIQHLAMDAYSVKVFISDIMDIYLSKTAGKPYPKPMRPYVPSLLKELSYIGSEKQKQDRIYWYESLANSTEPMFTDYMLPSRLKAQQKEHPEHRFANIHEGSAKGGVILKDVDATLTKKFMDMCDENGLSVQAALAMIIRTVLSAFNSREKDVSFKMIVNRRGTIADKKSGGIRINFFPMRSIVKEDESFDQATNDVEDVIYDMYKHADLMFMETLQERHKSMPADALDDSTYDSMGFSYQPLMQIPNKDEKTERTAKSVWYNNGACMIPLYVTVRHRADDEGFEFVFEYRVTPDPTACIEIFFKKALEVIKIVAENPSVKIGDVLDKIALNEREKNGQAD